jgi:6-pyruvoyltetrahydropterin/6-carboxytetrahydropterin synthase
MAYSIAKSFPFAASHQLEGLPADHKCTRLHGHNYEVDVEVSGETDGSGFLLDYGLLAPFADWLLAEVDHRHLNDLLEVNPTAENLAAWFHNKATVLLFPVLAGRHVTAVRVRETPRTVAEFRP